jgi:hypothetical protein
MSTSKSINVLSLRGLENFQPLDQSENPYCTAYAFCALAEIMVGDGRRLHPLDLMADEEAAEDGINTSYCARMLKTHGLRVLDARGRPTATIVRLECRPYDGSDLSAVLKYLAAGIPVHVGMRWADDVAGRLALSSASAKSQAEATAVRRSSRRQSATAATSSAGSASGLTHLFHVDHCVSSRFSDFCSFPFEWIHIAD